MAKVLVVGGGFGGVVAAESLAKKLGSDHEITLVSRSRRFLFCPAFGPIRFREIPSWRHLVRFARGAARPENPLYRRRNRSNQSSQASNVTFAHGDFVGEMPYDFLVLALGRRLATERVTGFFEHAYHLLDLDGAFKFGEAIKGFHRGHAVMGHCPGARLPVPAFETAFALSYLLEERNERDHCLLRSLVMRVWMKCLVQSLYQIPYVTPSVRAGLSSCPALPSTE